MFSKKIIVALDSNNFEEIIKLVGKDTTKKILKNLLENQNDIIKNPKRI